MISEKEYDKWEKTNKKNKQEFDQLSKRIEPYWDNKTRTLKKDAPEDIKKDYKRFVQLFNELSTQY